jgi:hypothetical protein
MCVRRGKRVLQKKKKRNIKEMSGKRMGEGKGRERKKYIGVRDK